MKRRSSLPKCSLPCRVSRRRSARCGSGGLPADPRQLARIRLWKTDTVEGSLIRERFQDAFPHWISMTCIIAESGDNDHIESVYPYNTSTSTRLWLQEPLVDQMIPIYFKEPTATLGKHRASQIFIRHEALKYTHSKDRLSEITRRDPSFIHLGLENRMRRTPTRFPTSLSWPTSGDRPSWM